MNSGVTYNEIIELPNTIIHNAEKYSEFADLLSKKLCDNFDLKETKNKIDELFDNFKEIKYLYNIPFEKIKVTPSYELKENAFTNNSNNSFENAVLKHLDKQLWVQKFYEKLVVVSTKITIEEAVYLVNTFFSKKSEEVIAEKLGISLRTLYNVKKSCVIKVWSELKIFYDEDDK